MLRHDQDVTEPRTRLDKWLWTVRLYKTRALATEEVAKGRLQVNGQPAKPSREARPGDLIDIRQGPVHRTLHVLGLSNLRGPAAVAQLPYAETPDSVARRERAAEQRRLGAEPAQAIEQGRPNKRRPPQARRLEPLEREPG